MSTQLGRVVSLVTEKATATTVQVGLEMIERNTGERRPSEAEYEGEGVAFAPGDVLFGKLRPYLAKSWLADIHGAAVGDFHVLRPDLTSVEPRFVHYFTLSRAFLDEVTAAVQGAKMPRANWDTVRNVRIHLPPISTQRAIADYLDRETAQIDTLVAKQEQLVTTLRERKAAVTSQTIEMPWAPLRPLRRLADCWDHLRIPLNAEERALVPGDVPYWGANSIQDYVCRALVNESIVLIGEDGAPFFDPFRPVAFAIDGPIWPNNHIHVLKPRDDTSPSWLAYALNSVDYSLYVAGSTRDKLNQSALLSIVLRVPPLDEQHRIVAHLDEQISKIDLLISKAEQFIALSRERRAALITAAVTGQLDVTERAA